LIEALKIARRASHPLAHRPLAEGEAPLRLRLAHLALQWLNDEKLAVQLARPVLPGAPAAQLLKDENFTAAELRQLLGPPQRIARQILYRRYLEQWSYDDPLLLHIEWDCHKGQEPQILTVQTLTPR
jgi:hypothetical protein